MAELAANSLEEKQETGSVLPQPAEARPVTRLDVEVVQNFERFLELQHEWNAAMSRARISYPFVSHEWISAWWECFGSDKEMHIVVVRDHDSIMAIAPMMIVFHRMYGVRLRCLQLIYNWHAFRCDFIVCGGYDRVYEAIWNHILACRDQWQVVILPQVPSQSPTVPAICSLAQNQRFLTGRWQTSSPYLTLEGNWDEYFNSLARKHRSNLRNRFRRLERLGKVERRVISGGAALPAALAEGYKLEAKTWKGEEGTAISSVPELDAFYSKLARIAADRGWLRLQFLELGTRKIAFDYSLQYANSIYVLKSGYDPEFSPFSPYNLLSYENIRDAYQQGLNVYDFLGIDDDWKMRWTSTTRVHDWLYVFPRTARHGLLYYLKFRFFPRMNSLRPYRRVRDAALKTFQFLCGKGWET